MFAWQLDRTGRFFWMKKFVAAFLAGCLVSSAPSLYAQEQSCHVIQGKDSLGKRLEEMGVSSEDIAAIQNQDAPLKQLSAVEGWALSPLHFVQVWGVEPGAIGAVWGERNRNVTIAAVVVVAGVVITWTLIAGTGASGAAAGGTGGFWAGAATWAQQFALVRWVGAVSAPLRHFIGTLWKPIGALGGFVWKYLMEALVIGSAIQTTAVYGQKIHTENLNLDDIKTQFKIMLQGWLEGVDKQSTYGSIKQVDLSDKTVIGKFVTEKGYVFTAEPLSEEDPTPVFRLKGQGGVEFLLSGTTGDLIPQAPYREIMAYRKKGPSFRQSLAKPLIDEAQKQLRALSAKGVCQDRVASFQSALDILDQQIEARDIDESFMHQVLVGVMKAYEESILIPL